jgi:hypothetical protein
MMFQRQNISEYNGTSPDGKIQNKTDNILIGDRWQSSKLDVRSFR